MIEYELNDIAEITSSKRIFYSDYVDEGIPFYRSREIINLDNGEDLKELIFITQEKYHDIKNKFGAPEKDDILITSVGTIGNTYLVRENDEFYFKDGNLTWLRNWKGKAEPKFVFYWLKSPIGQGKIYQQLIGSSQKALTIAALKKIKIEVPEDKITQRKIASILSAYDDLIENNLKRIKLLEEKAFLRYKQIVREEKLIEGCVGNLADVKSGYAFKGADWTDEGFPVIKIKNIGNNDIDLTNCSLIPENIAEAASKFKLNAGDLLIAMTGATVGKIGVMPKTETSFYLNQRVGIFKPKVENSDLFLFCFFNEPSTKNAVESLASGAAQPNISGSQIESIKLFYPKLETVSEFGNSIKSHFELIWNLKQQNTKLREARDIFLPRLMNGEIEV